MSVKYRWIQICLKQNGITAFNRLPHLKELLESGRILSIPHATYCVSNTDTLTVAWQGSTFPPRPFEVIIPKDHYVFFATIGYPPD